MSNNSRYNATADTITTPIDKTCVDCHVQLDGTNFAASQAKKHFFICIPCRKKRMVEATELRAVVKLPSGEFKNQSHRNKKQLLRENEGSVFVGKFNRQQMSFDDFVKSVNSGVLPTFIPAARKIRIKGPRSPRKPPTAQQKSDQMCRRVIDLNRDRTLNRYAREKAMWQNLQDENGVVLPWFATKWENQTHCAITGIEFEPFGPNSKSPDQISAGDGYGESNVQIVCQWFNYAKHTWSNDVARDFIKRAAQYLNKSLEQSLDV